MGNKQVKDNINERKLISHFLLSLNSKNYSNANKYLNKIVEKKLNKRVEKIINNF
jgi:hypothetical protein